MLESEAHSVDSEPLTPIRFLGEKEDEAVDPPREHPKIVTLEAPVLGTLDRRPALTRSWLWVSIKVEEPTRIPEVMAHERELGTKMDPAGDLPPMQESDIQTEAVANDDDSRKHGELKSRGPRAAPKTVTETEPEHATLAVRAELKAGPLNVTTKEMDWPSWFPTVTAMPRFRIEL